MTQVDRRITNKLWFQQAFEKFPFTLFSGVQSFVLYQNLTDFIGGVLQFPIALAQYPFYLASGNRYRFPSRDSELQRLINLGRYTNTHSDVI